MKEDRRAEPWRPSSGAEKSEPAKAGLSGRPEEIARTRQRGTSRGGARSAEGELAGRADSGEHYRWSSQGSEAKTEAAADSALAGARDEYRTEQNLPERRAKQSELRRKRKKPRKGHERSAGRAEGICSSGRRRRTGEQIPGDRQAERRKASLQRPGRRSERRGIALIQQRGTSGRVRAIPRRERSGPCRQRRALPLDVTRSGEKRACRGRAADAT